MSDKTVRNLTQKVEDILWNDWDPIGVNSHDGTWPDDEYNMYVPHIAGLLIKDVDVEEIAEALGEIAKSAMGLGRSPSHSLATAQKLYSLKDQGK